MNVETRQAELPEAAWQAIDRLVGTLYGETSAEVILSLIRQPLLQAVVPVVPPKPVKPIAGLPMWVED